MTMCINCVGIHSTQTVYTQYFQQLPAMLHHKRKKLASCLESVGLQPIMPEGGYFMVADISSVIE